MPERASWGETWMRFAVAMAARSKCIRGGYGAVIVTADNQVVSTGYTGFPAGMPGECATHCPRAHLRPEETPRDYGNCLSLHGEVNCVARADYNRSRGGTMYVSGVPCWDCSKVIANCGVAEVVYLEEAEDISYRKPELNLKLLEQSGLTVVAFEARKL